MLVEHIQLDIPSWVLSAPYMPLSVDVGDLDSDDLFYAKGRVLHSWEYLNHEMSLLYAMNKEDIHLSHRQMYKIKSFSRRCELIKIFVAEWHEIEPHRHSFLSDVIELLDVCKALSFSRNRIAHGSIVEKDGEFISFQPFFLENKEYFLVDSISNMTRINAFCDINFRWNSEVLRQINNVILSISYKLHKVRHRMFRNYKWEQDDALCVDDGMLNRFGIFSPVVGA